MQTVPNETGGAYYTFGATVCRAGNVVDRCNTPKAAKSLAQTLNAALVADEHAGWERFAGAVAAEGQTT